MNRLWQWNCLNEPSGDLPTRGARLENLAGMAFRQEALRHKAFRPTWLRPQAALG